MLLMSALLFVDPDGGVLTVEARVQAQRRDALPVGVDAAVLPDEPAAGAVEAEGGADLIAAERATERKFTTLRGYSLSENGAAKSRGYGAKDERSAHALRR